MPRKRPSVQVFDGEWVTISWVGQHEQCCNCGMLHEIDYRVKGGKLQFRGKQLLKKYTVKARRRVK
jgi:hypothetical protein